LLRDRDDVTEAAEDDEEEAPEAATMGLYERVFLCELNRGRRLPERGDGGDDESESEMAEGGSRGFGEERLRSTKGETTSGDKGETGTREKEPGFAEGRGET